MSGGHYDYNQFRIDDIIRKMERDIERGYFSESVLPRVLDGLMTLRRAAVYAQRIDWLVSGDDGDETFLVRLQDDLSELEVSHD